MSQPPVLQRFTQNTPVLQACMCSDPSGDNNLTVNPATPHFSSKHLRRFFTHPTIRQTTHSSSNTGAKIHPSTPSSISSNTCYHLIIKTCTITQHWIPFRTNVCFKNKGVQQNPMFSKQTPCFWTSLRMKKKKKRHQSRCGSKVYHVFDVEM